MGTLPNGRVSARLFTSLSIRSLSRTVLTYLRQLTGRPFIENRFCDLSDDIVGIYRDGIVYIYGENDVPAVGKSDDADVVNGADHLV